MRSLIMEALQKVFYALINVLFHPIYYNYLCWWVCKSVLIVILSFVHFILFNLLFQIL